MMPMSGELSLVLTLGVMVGMAILLGFLFRPTGSADPCEMNCRAIKLGKKLGEGSFGVVYQGLYNNTPVAVKTLRRGTMDPRDFLKEAQIMKTMEHPNLIRLLAVCTEEPIYIITELMKNGSLLDYLKVRVGRLRLYDQIEMAAQVASGMAYLEMKNYIHRDLAARNVLVGENNVYKVADFGLARVLQATPMLSNQTKMYYISVGKAIFPLRWTAPEAIANERFTIKCDVWSFGILLYEIMTFGEIPYPNMTDSQVKQMVPNGYRMPCPVDPYCSKDMYKIMLDCWKENKYDRPTFKALKMRLRDVSG
ncbi:tyrosine-protein kinase SRK2-like [Salvelinus namaycush]|uniref:non-specific protein-tyrosine kinase n=1 Tax=Salvelinus namaycush TaxID=8040 RepID=A0A8U0R0I4_SALNM|nr:tyrosine-protein kinase SRK2-like [Salvelinus namaycush]XP_038851992.1 tyrosine-protein kinase SRK2-like [Salvelinus namaycush]